MALGVDQWAAEYALGSSIPLLCYIPFEGQEMAWPEESRNHYYELLSRRRDKKIICEGGYAPWKMQKRNEAMVNDCDLLIAIWDGSSGGTANCIKYAQSKKKTIIYINPKEL